VGASVDLPRGQALRSGLLEQAQDFVAQHPRRGIEGDDERAALFAKFRVGPPGWSDRIVILTRSPLSH
jgi:hypothetical protein